jgi:GWxTD domain-containing protein
LGRVHFQRQPSKIIPYERLKELLKQDHKSQAIKKFNQALKSDPEYKPAHYFLARTYLEKGDAESLEKAQGEFIRLAGDNQDYHDIQYLLGHTYQKMGNFTRAIPIFKQIQQQMPDYSRAQIRLAEIYFEQNDAKSSTECYFEGIENLEDQEMLDYLFEEQKVILTPVELNRFEAAPYSARKKLFKIFWKQRDPDPSTLENERLMEHFRRVKFARDNFHFTAPPYYDDRGKIYIKYGPPDDRYNAPDGNLPTKDNESWTYESIQKGLVFDFVSDGGYFHQVEDLTDAALAGYGYNSRLAVAAQLYSNRSTLSRTYSNLAVSFSSDKLSDFHRDRNDALATHPGEIYRHDYHAQTFPFITKWAQFRGDSNQTQVELYTAIPGAITKFEKVDNHFLNYTDFYVEILDSNFDSIIKKQDRFSIKIDSIYAMNSRHFLLQNNYDLAPGVYEAAFVMSSPDQSTKSVQKRNLVVRDFSSDRLLLSDVQLSTDISANIDNLNQSIVKKDLKIMPYPFSRVMKNKPIHLYFEIYNLNLNNQKQSNFEVAYNVKTIRADRNFWQKTFGSIPKIFSGREKNIISTIVQREGDSETAFEYISFDLKNLESGVIEIQVAVTDRNSQQSVSNAIEFTLIK